MTNPKEKKHIERANSVSGSANKVFQEELAIGTHL